MRFVSLAKSFTLLRMHLIFVIFMNLYRFRVILHMTIL